MLSYADPCARLLLSVGNCWKVKSQSLLKLVVGRAASVAVVGAASSLAAHFYSFATRYAVLFVCS